jgi:hypothetical protein
MRLPTKTLLLATLGTLGTATLALLVSQRISPPGYTANLEMRARARTVDLSQIRYITLQGPHLSLRGADGRMAAPATIEDPKEMRDILDGLRQSCRKQEMPNESLQFGVPDLIQFWPKVKPEQFGSETFEIDAGNLLRESGPKLTSALKKYHKE